MPVPKYNWIELKKEFFASDILTIKDFLKSKNVPMDFNMTAGWAGEKQEYQKRVLTAVTSRAVDVEAEGIAETRARQARLSRFMQLKGAKRIEKAETDELSIDDARKMLTSGLEQERRALGIEGPGSQNLTQINIGGPKTNLDKLIETMSYEQLLGFIAELKRLRAGHSLQEAPVKSSGQTQEGEVV